MAQCRRRSRRRAKCCGHSLTSKLKTCLPACLSRRSTPTYPQSVVRGSRERERERQKRWRDGERRMKNGGLGRRREEQRRKKEEGETRTRKKERRRTIHIGHRREDAEVCPGSALSSELSASLSHFGPRQAKSPSRTLSRVCWQGGC